MRAERSEPILPSRNLDETRAFYKHLGFTPWFDGRQNWEYEILSRGHLVIHFYLNSNLTPGESDSMCYWRVKDADAFHEELAKANLPLAGIPRLTKPRDEQWGMREFSLVDQSGNLVRVGHDLDAEHAYVPA